MTALRALSHENAPYVPNAALERPATPGFEGGRFIAYHRATGQLDIARALGANTRLDSAELYRQRADSFLDSIDRAIFGDSDITDPAAHARHQRAHQRLVHQATGAMDYLKAVEERRSVPDVQQLEHDIRLLRRTPNTEAQARFFQPNLTVEIRGSTPEDGHGYNRGYALAEPRAKERNADAAAVSRALDEIHGLRDVLNFISVGEAEAFRDEFYNALHKLPEADHGHHITLIYQAIGQIPERNLRKMMTALFDETEERGNWFEAPRGAVQADP